jgi:uncharacterized surface protein with fasciclin (FAS1) repeats
MRKELLRILYVIPIIGCVLTGCRSDIDDYYARPDWLEPNIYDNLLEKGTFTSYLAVVDKAGYKDVLSRAGFYTVFAPTDSAFHHYLQENGLESVEEIDEETADKIVRYSLVYNVFTKEKIDDFQSTSLEGWDPDKAFKRTTTYYEWVYEEDIEDINGSSEKVWDQNGVPLLPEDDPVFNANDNNNKHIPYFTDAYFGYKNLSSYDYNYFFPGTEFSGFNVVDAKVTEYDIICENGIVHAVDKVILPLKSIGVLLDENPDYSEFKKVLDKYVVEYDLAPPDFLSRYEQVSGVREDVYIKTYPLLNFAPYCENYMKYGGGQQYDAQIDGWTLFAPNNTAVNNFFNYKFLLHYESLDNMPPAIISEFVNAHMFRTTVWPSKFETSVNMFGEPARFDPESNVKHKAFGSNGIFYGTNTVQKTDAFYTVLGPIILDPDYALMLQALFSSELYYVVKNPAIRLTIFMLENDVFDSLRLTYNVNTSAWELNNPSLGTNASVAVNRLVNMHVLLGDTLDVSGNDVVQTYGGEYLKYQTGFLWGVGNKHASEFLLPKGKLIHSNGVTYKLSQALKFSVENIGRDIEGNGNFSMFYNYLEKSASSPIGPYVYNLADKAIANIASTENNTLLIPDNNAMQAAVNDGILPVIGFADFTQEQQEQVLNFVMYHALPGVIAYPGSEIIGTKETLYKTTEDDPKTYVEIKYEGGIMSVTDRNGRTANVVTYNSNVLSNRAMLHQIDKYLKYNIETK